FAEALKLDREKPELVERMVFKRVGSDLRLAEVGFRKGVGIDDKNAVGLEVGHIHLERRGVHGDQDVHRVARGIYLVRRKVKLVAADTREGARWSANFGGKVGEGGDVVAVEGDRIGELAARNLHAVAGVPGEANDR